MPLVFRFGISDQYFKKRLLLAFDIDKNINANLGWHFGGEFGFTKNFKGRFGVQGEQGEGFRETDVGFGYTLRASPSIIRSACIPSERSAASG